MEARVEHVSGAGSERRPSYRRNFLLGMAVVSAFTVLAIAVEALTNPKVGGFAFLACLAVGIFIAERMLDTTRDPD